MDCGKVTESIYERSVVKVMQANSGGAGLKADCAILTNALESEQGVDIVSGQAIANGMDSNVAARAYLASVNHLAVCCPNLAILEMPHAYVNLTLVVPEKLREIKVRNMIENAAIWATLIKIPILSCNVQVLPTVTEVMAVCVSNAGITSLVDKPKPNTGAAEEDIVMTKWIALEGTSLIANDSFDVLCARYPRDIVEEAAGFSCYLPVISEAACAVKSGASSLLLPREGGIFGGLWQLASGKGVGLVVDLKCIPVRQETIELCEYFDINPYELLAGGSLLATTKNGGELVHALRALGIPAAVIGHTVKGNDRIICRDGETRYLEPARGDEIFRYHTYKLMRTATNAYNA